MPEEFILALFSNITINNQYILHYSVIITTFQITVLICNQVGVLGQLDRLCRGLLNNRFMLYLWTLHSYQMNTCE